MHQHVMRAAWLLLLIMLLQVQNTVLPAPPSSPSPWPHEILPPRTPTFNTGRPSSAALSVASAAVAELSACSCCMASAVRCMAAAWCAALLLLPLLLLL
jgi:hypothetical protein